ncbi:uncharacterized protein LAESUDRAFT_730377 [Laetiporus sulphureus 93-53]|uniref:Uncharacterized protein n=1 Tax=Laetiporus sulphureus 93-53 TaxID=1314785 RepID=A0A165C4U9_9APHY|nr:uncharacterized protein LAESUDRAFT_730377 [Laetiporus sulphureus 93-53]KZT02207.1 hypothetical protein LAESUDRAFT_730377 [Laetiporus sulphureus 93-53]
MSGLANPLPTHATSPRSIAPGVHLNMTRPCKSPESVWYFSIFVVTFAVATTSSFQLTYAIWAFRPP